MKHCAYYVLFAFALVCYVFPIDLHMEGQSDWLLQSSGMKKKDGFQGMEGKDHLMMEGKNTYLHINLDWMRVMGMHMLINL